MTRSYLAVLAVTIFGPILASASQAPSSSIVAIRNVTIVPMDTERSVSRQTVIIQGDRILRIGEASIPIPSGAMVIDGSGKYLLPGLADMHVHLAEPTDPQGIEESELFLFLANGVTTIRSMRGFANHLELRDRANRGELLGPRMVLAGQGLDGEIVKSPEQGEAAVRSQKADHYDLVKVLPGLSLASYDAIAQTAHELRIPFAGHIPADVGLLHAFEMGQQSVEHLDGYLELLHGSEPIPRDKLAEVVRQTMQVGIWNAPTMSIMETNLGLISIDTLLSRPELEYVPSSFVQQWLHIMTFRRPSRAVAETMQRNRMALLKVMTDSRARLLLSTDSPNLFNAPGFSIHREMEMMADAGMTPFQILRSGTAQVGGYLKQDCGVIKVGACADLVLLDRNPLTNVRNVNHPSGVIVRGSWLPTSEITRRLELIRNNPVNYRYAPGPH